MISRSTGTRGLVMSIYEADPKMCILKVKVNYMNLYFKTNIIYSYPTQMKLTFKSMSKYCIIDNLCLHEQRISKQLRSAKSTLQFALNLSPFANCRSQFLLDRLGRCLKLTGSSESISCHEFVFQFGLEFF